MKSYAMWFLVWVIDNMLVLGAGTYVGYRFHGKIGAAVDAVEGWLGAAYSRLKG
jgi:hypothetical protein